MRGLWISVVLVDCLVMLSYLTFVETTKNISRPSFRRSFGDKQSTSPGDPVLFEEGNIILPQQPGDKKLRLKKRRLPPTSFYGRKGKARLLKKRLKKESDNAFGQNKDDLSKRDFFFAPASQYTPYDQMASPVDRRMFLVHRGERGSSCCDLCIVAFYLGLRAICIYFDT